MRSNMAKGIHMAMGCLLIGTTVYAADKLNIKILAPFVRADQGQRITCRVPRDDRNRELEVGIENFQSSFRQLDGEESRVSFEIYFQHIPCEAGRAYCRVNRNDGTSEQVVAAQTITGCDGQ